MVRLGAQSASSGSLDFRARANSLVAPALLPIDRVAVAFSEIRSVFSGDKADLVKSFEDAYFWRSDGNAMKKPNIPRKICRMRATEATRRPNNTSDLFRNLFGKHAPHYMESY